MNILFTINREYIEHVKDCIYSIVRFPTIDGYDIYIMHSDLQIEDEIQLAENMPAEVKIHFIYVDSERWGYFPKTSRYPIQIYYRIFASMFLPITVERILYLDADTLVINPLNKLYDMDFEGNYILACTHTRKVLNKINQVRLGMEEECAYINSGVMLMNLKLLREEQDYHEIEIKNSIFQNSLIFQGLPPIKYQNLMYFPLFLPL